MYYALDCGLLVLLKLYMTAKLGSLKSTKAKIFYRLDRMRQVCTLYTTKFDDLEQEFEITTDHKI